MNVSICGIVGVPGNYGGFETFAENLILNTPDSFQYTVYCDRDFEYDPKLVPINVNLVKLPLKANGWQSVLYDALCMAHSIFTRKTILLLGCSGGWFVPITRLFGAKVITNIAGLEWGRSKWGKLASIFLKWSEKIAVRYSNIIVTDNFQLKKYVYDAYRVDSKVIAYGADHVLTSSLVRFDDLANNFDLGFSDYFISVGRCQPDNHIKEIVESFVNSKENLIAVSNWKSCQYGLDIISEFSNNKNIKLLDPIYDIEEISSLRINAKGYIHGHSAGGTNPTLVEAMYLGIPILSYDVSFNRYTTNNNACFWSCKNSLMELVNNFTHETMAKGVADSLIYAKKYYTWDFISKEYIKLFSEVNV